MYSSRFESKTTPNELYLAAQAYIAAATFAMSTQPNFVTTMDAFLEEITRLNGEIMRLRIEHANQSDEINVQIESLEASILSITIERNQVAQIAAEAMDGRADFYIENAALQVHKKELQAQVALAKWAAEMYGRIADQSITEQKNGSEAFVEVVAAAQEQALENRIDKRKIAVLIQAIKIQACIVNLYKAAVADTTPLTDKAQILSDTNRLEALFNQQRYAEAIEIIPDVEVYLPDFTAEADEDILPPSDGTDETFAEFIALRGDNVDVSPVISTEPQPANGSEIAIYLERINNLFPSLSNLNPESLNHLLKIFPAFLEYISKVSKKDLNIIDYLMKKLDVLFKELEYSEEMTAEKILQLAQMRIYCEELQAKIDYMTNIISPAELLQTEGQLMIIESPFDRVQQYMIEISKIQSNLQGLFLKVVTRQELTDSECFYYGSFCLNNFESLKKLNDQFNTALDRLIIHYRLIVSVKDSKLSDSEQTAGLIINEFMKNNSIEINVLIATYNLNLL